MPPQILSWLRETGKLTVGYLGVGFCFAGAGLLGFLLQMAGWKGRSSIALPLVFGFSLAYFFWRWFERTKPRRAVPQISRELALALSDSVTGASWAELVEMRLHRPGVWAVALAPRTSIAQTPQKPVFEPGLGGATYAAFGHTSS